MNCNVYIFAVSIQIHNVLLACLSIIQSDNHKWNILSESTEIEPKAGEAKRQGMTKTDEELNVS